ncbi:hypothetical protein [Lysobacter rhizosphaerae]
MAAIRLVPPWSNLARILRSAKLPATGLSLVLLTAASASDADDKPTSAAAAASVGGTLQCNPSVATAVPQPTQEQLEAAGLADLTLAPDSARRDLVAAPFSHPTAVTNPLFPIASLRSAILNGHVDNKVFHTETTLLPYTQLIEWSPGQCIRVLVSQYMAWLGGSLQEVAIDLYAQADDGSVWYFGEAVSDYDVNGRIVTNEGTWHAGIEGSAAMIMPANPQVGDANRAENIPGIVFEEVVVNKINRTYPGPSGRVHGAMVGVETHDDGTHSGKVFAPGYGEFISTDGPDIEAMALAAPIDALPGGVPAALRKISKGADRIFASHLDTPAQWQDAEKTAMDMLDAWNAFRTGNVPPRLIEPTDLALRNLLAQVRNRNRTKTLAASVDAAYASNDLQLRYRPIVKIDEARFELWARRALITASTGSRGGARSAFVSMKWIRDRFANRLDPTTRTMVETLLKDLDGAIFDNDLPAAAEAARDLREVMLALK